MIPTAPTCDAVLLPAALKRGRTQIERVRSLNAIAGPLLGVDPAAATIWYHDQKVDGYFAATDPGATLCGPRTAPPALRGRPRYDWVESPGGIRLGYLRAEFRGESFAPLDPVALGLWRPGMR